MYYYLFRYTYPTTFWVWYTPDWLPYRIEHEK
jgi:hypothetical protein